MSEQIAFTFLALAPVVELTKRPRAKPRARSAKQGVLFAFMKKPKRRRRKPAPAPRRLRSPPSASLEVFVRLLSECAQTYADLMAATGISFRTAKERMRIIRREHQVKDRHLPSENGCGRGPLQMWIGDADDGDDMPIFGAPPPAEIKTACPMHKGSKCMHCDGSGYRIFARADWKKKREIERARLAAAL